MERLQKVMARAGVASRRKSEEIIAQGRVKVDGKTVTEMGYKVDPDKAQIEVDGELITREKLVYIMLNKPVGYITTAEDTHDRKTVMDLIEDIPQQLHYVGRLDQDTEGLLLMTNDGDLTYALTHPSHEVDKVYLMTVKGSVSAQAVKELEEGVELEDGLTAPAQVEIIKRTSNYTTMKMVIHEGRNRQVRRMMDKVGHPVLRLKRIKEGPLSLDNLKVGKYRHLTEEELKILKRIEKSMPN